MRVLFVGVISNRQWILGNFIEEIARRIPLKSRKIWLPTAFAKNRTFERHFPRYLPSSEAYYFSYPTLFAHYANNAAVADLSLIHI